MYVGVDRAGKSWFAVFLTDDGNSQGDYYLAHWNL